MTPNEKAREYIRALPTEQIEAMLAKIENMPAALVRDAGQYLKQRTGNGTQLKARVANAANQMAHELNMELARRLVDGV